MDSLELTREIAAPVDAVWEVLVDLERAPERIRAITELELLSEGPFDVGTRWRETRVMFGKEATEEMYVTTCQPKHLQVIEADGRGVHYATTIELTELGEGSTALRYTFGAETSGALASFMAKTMGRLFRGATLKAMSADLEDIEAASIAIAAGS